MNNSNDHYTEHRTLHDGKSLPWDVAHHIYMRAGAGKILILHEDPDAFLPLLQKNLLRLCRQAQSARLQTANAAMVAELTRQIVLMQHLQPTTLLPIDCPGAQVFIMRPDDFDGLLPYLATVYITCEISKNLLDRVQSCMTPGSVIIQY